MAQKTHFIPLYCQLHAPWAERQLLNTHIFLSPFKGASSVQSPSYSFFIVVGSGTAECLTMKRLNRQKAIG